MKKIEEERAFHILSEPVCPSQLVEQRIHETCGSLPERRYGKRKRKYALAVILVAATLAGGGYGFAKQVLKGIGYVTEDNHFLVAQREPVPAETIMDGQTFPPRETEPARIRTSLIAEEELERLMIGPGREVKNLEVQEKEDGFYVDEFYFHNGDLAVFSLPGEQIWELTEDAEVHLEFTVKNTDGQEEEGSNLEIGYVENGLCYRIIHGSHSSYAVAWTPDHTGSYCFYVRNLSAGRVLIDGLKIRLE